MYMDGRTLIQLQAYKEILFYIARDGCSRLYAYLAWRIGS